MQQFLLTLRFFATGSFILSASDFAGVSTTSADRIIHRVTIRLRSHFIKFPITDNEIKKEQLEFYKISRFSRVEGCIDCTHVWVQSFGKLFYLKSVYIGKLHKYARNLLDLKLVLFILL